MFSAGITSADADWLLERADVLYYDAGSSILVQGALGTCFHFISEGRSTKILLLCV